jgi:hypothetical protein
MWGSGSDEVQRRAFLVAGGRAMVLALAASFGLSPRTRAGGDALRRTSVPAIWKSFQTKSRFLKIYLCSKPGNKSLPSNPAHISIVLNHRLDQEWSVKQQYVELNAPLRLPSNHAGREEL